jgi:hypothetical protein
MTGLHWSALLRRLLTVSGGRTIQTDHTVGVRMRPQFDPRSMMIGLLKRWRGISYCNSSVSAYCNHGRSKGLD